MKLFIRSVELHQSLNVQLLFRVGCCLIYEDVNSDGMFFFLIRIAGLWGGDLIQLAQFSAELTKIVNGNCIKNICFDFHQR